MNATETTTRLVGGPFDGREVPVSDPRTPLLLQGDPVPEGMVARYRPGREKGTHRFREYDRIAGTVDLGGGQHGD